MAPSGPAGASWRPFPLWLKRVGAFDIILWALGAMFSEALSQGAEALAILLTLVGAFFGPPIPRRIRPVLAFGFGLALWQIASPILAQAMGIHPTFPKGSKFCQFFDTAALAFLVCVTRFGVPWKAVGAIAAAGWFAHGFAALVQHLGLWPDALLKSTSFKADPARLHENFGVSHGPVRHAGLGLYYHRLKLAHHAVAFFGTALSLAFSRKAGASTRQRRLAAVLTVVIALALWLTYARAALGAIVAVFAVGFILMAGRRALAPILAVCLLAGCLVAFLPSWQQRFTSLSGTWIGADRRFAWTAAASIAAEHPVTGVGFGNYQSALKLRITRPEKSGEAPSPMFSKALSAQARYLNTDLITLDAHNLPLMVFAETGLVGLILFGLLHLSLLAALWERHRRGCIVSTGALLAWIGFHALGVVHYLPFHTGVHLSFAFVWAMGLAEDQPFQERKTVPEA